MSFQFIVVLIAVYISLLVVTWIFYREFKRYKDLYRETLTRNIGLSEELGKLKAAEIVRSEERKNAEEKISKAHSGSNRERFDFINNELRNSSGN